ncbi:mesoderm posterior protein 2 [Dipodomys spectabilis]|uniref:mesoderm posterior protein 2 n=1 Tax=Dipodomys spectabilis TaxID=105255 RepID=UPI001C53D377|nr:mesoderm posterior protein 2 [Dipodomys spectabilis]
MAQSPPPPPPPRGPAGPEPWVFARGWARAGHADSASPASSSDSSGSCPCDGARRPPRPAPPAAAAAAPPAPRRPRTRVAGGGPRRSASEREKLRMRTLARALLRLRRFLPPSVAPAGQSLTKVETLRLAARYIAHLSAVLGLRRRRPDAAGPRGCPLCPGPGPGPDGAAWGDPPAAPPPPGCPPSPPRPAPAAPLWTPPRAAPWTPPPAPPELAEVFRNVPVSPEPCLSLESPPLLALPSCQRPQPQLQWGCWGPDVTELLPGPGDQEPGPIFPLSVVSPGLSPGLRLGGCPELWHEDLDGPQLGIF